MRIARQEFVLIFFAQSDQLLEECVRFFFDREHLCAEVELDVYGYLVIPASAAMDLFACVTDPLREQTLHLRMDVFDVLVDREAACPDLGEDLLAGLAG